MGAKELYQLQASEGYVFVGIWGTKTNLERRGGSVNISVNLGYTKIVRKPVKTRKIVKVEGGSRIESTSAG